MIDNKIIDRLQNLKYLGKLKGANVSILSKKSEYHDMVKFFAIIDEDNVIQKITYKATGCTNFMAMCSFFCELVEGKKVSTALKINKEDLEKFVVLNKSAEHVYSIIFNTFALLIKKYNKAIESGKINNSKSDKKDERVNETKKTKTTKKIQKPLKVESVIVSPTNDNKVIKVVQVTEETHVKHEDNKVEVKTTKKSNEIHLGHLSSLQEKIKTKESHDKSLNKVQHLNSILDHLDHKHKEDVIVIEEAPKMKKGFFSRFKKK